MIYTDAKEEFTEKKTLFLRDVNTFLYSQYTQNLISGPNTIDSACYKYISENGGHLSNYKSEKQN